MKKEPTLSAPTVATPVATPVLSAEGVERRYGALRPALQGIDLQVQRGEFVVLEGPGGSGKSVLLRLLAGLDTPSAGVIRIAGEDLAAVGPLARAHLRRSLGILSAAAPLLVRHSVLDNVAFAAWVADVGADEGLRRARAALELVGLDANRLGGIRCADLASGEARRVALARALVNRPALLLLDDLLEDLDAPVAAQLVAVVDQFAGAGVTVVASTRAPAHPRPDTDPGANAASAPATRIARGWPARARILRLRDGRLAA
ncbi:polyamine/opine/phosphonate or spermidine/putrescine transporter ATP-binding protein [Burkholderiales bacterium GJ-E10]|nr:polyamine/opine/phosphonate or spermidine/putrescine transporter ATP-binding protein [Burkholderiales bacterium GJ-E10]